MDAAYSPTDVSVHPRFRPNSMLYSLCSVAFILTHINVEREPILSKKFKAEDTSGLAVLHGLLDFSDAIFLYQEHHLLTLLVNRSACS